MRISDWSSDVCSSDLKAPICHGDGKPQQQREGDAAVKNAWDDEVQGKEAFGGIARRSSHDVLFCALGFEDERADRIDAQFEQGNRARTRPPRQDQQTRAKGKHRKRDSQGKKKATAQGDTASER